MLSAATGYNPAAAAAAAQAQSQSAAGAWGNMGYPLYRFAGPPQAYGSFVQSTVRRTIGHRRVFKDS